MSHREGNGILYRLYFKEHFISIMQIYALFVYLKRAVCPPLPARHGGAGVSAKADGGGESSSGLVICFVFTPVLGIVLGDNKKNKTHTIASHTISIKYALILKNSISKNNSSKIDFYTLFLPYIL
jgi:hypothetical protein